MSRNQQAEQPRQQSTAVATTLAPSRLPILPAIAKEFEIKPAEWRVLIDQIFPTAKTVEAVTMALSYCRARNLDIFKKPVHIVPMWSSALGRMVETVWPGIAEIRTTAARTGEYGGIDAVEFGPMVKRKFTGQTGGNRPETITKEVSYPEWASVVVWRFVKGHKVAFHAKVFWDETYASVGKTEVPNDMWAKRPRGQLDKCVEAAAIRKAFPEEVGSMFAAEEMEGRTIDIVANDVKAAPTASSPPPPPPEEDATDVEVFDAEAFADKIIGLVASAADEDALIAMWEENRVDDLLEGKSQLDDLYDARTKRIAVFDGDVTDEPEGGEQTDEPSLDFPGDTK